MKMVAFYHRIFLFFKLGVLSSVSGDAARPSPRRALGAERSRAPWVRSALPAPRCPQIKAGLQRTTLRLSCRFHLSHSARHASAPSPARVQSPAPNTSPFTAHCYRARVLGGCPRWARARARRPRPALRSLAREMGKCPLPTHLRVGSLGRSDVAPHAVFT